MKFTGTDIEGLLILEPSVFRDERGIFLEYYNEREFRANGINIDFVQDNQSISKKGVIRGLHFQEHPHAQGKLVRVAAGIALDVAVDIRPGSSSYGKTFSIELSSENNKMLWIPGGFAHGFEALTDDMIFTYKVSQYYHKESECGILFNDPDLDIAWKSSSPIVSEKDLQLLTFKEYSKQKTQ
jgi:dTDP-4-dehydrorhamnose 3,5-epimerase